MSGRSRDDRPHSTTGFLCSTGSSQHLAAALVALSLLLRSTNSSCGLSPSSRQRPTLRACPYPCPLPITPYPRLPHFRPPTLLSQHFHRAPITPPRLPRPWSYRSYTSDSSARIQPFPLPLSIVAVFTPSSAILKLFNLYKVPHSARWTCLRQSAGRCIL
jgi:hypothetical protein